MILRSNLREVCAYLKAAIPHLEAAGSLLTANYALSTVAKAMRLVETPYV